MPTSIAIDETYRAYALLLLRRHHLLLRGQEESDEAEQIESRLSDLWEKLDEPQRRSLRGISSDLNWVRRRGLPAPKGRRPEDVSEKDLIERTRLDEAQDWHSLLDKLRDCSPLEPPADLAYWRAKCYDMLRLPQVAAPFVDLAVELARGNSRRGRVAFEALRQLDPAMAFERASSVIASSGDYPPVVVAISIGFVIDFLGNNVSAFDVSALADQLREARSRLDVEPTPDEERVWFCMVAGNELHSFGFVKEAQELFEQGLALDPENGLLLGGLGEVLYENDRSRAVSLLQKAILAGMRLVRPYLHLAQHHLVNHEYHLAKGYATQAAELARDNNARGLAFDIMAISSSELGTDDQVVLNLLREAAKLVPNSERIASNLATFEKRVRDRSPASWMLDEDPAVFEAREGRLRVDSRNAVFAQ